MLESGKNKIFVKRVSKKSLLWFFVVLFIAICMYGAFGYGRAERVSAAMDNRHLTVTVPVVLTTPGLTNVPMCRRPTVTSEPEMPRCKPTITPEPRIPTPTHTVKEDGTVTATPTREKKPKPIPTTEEKSTPTPTMDMEKKPTPSPTHPTPTPTIGRSHGPVMPPTSGFPLLPPTGSNPGDTRPL